MVRPYLALGCVGWLGFVGAAATAARGSEIERISVSSTAVQASAASSIPALSATGSFVAFESLATNLVPGQDTNQQEDVFVRNTLTGFVIRCSRTPAGNAGNGASFEPSISADGRFVAFHSSASDLVPGDTNGKSDVFVLDTATQQMTRVSTSMIGDQGNGDSALGRLSADGSVITFQSSASNLVANDTNGQFDIFVKTLADGAVQLVSRSPSEQANGSSFRPELSGDGRFVAFASFATNLFAGTDGNGVADLFLFDRIQGTLETLSQNAFGTIANAESQLPRLSFDGRFCVFQSKATNLITSPDSSVDDEDTVSDVFLRDRDLGRLRVISNAPDGSPSTLAASSPSISDDGSVVAFLGVGQATSTPSVCVFDGNTEVVVELARTDLDGSGPDAACSVPVISRDGRRVAFASDASNLVAGDTNGARDVFVAGYVRAIAGDRLLGSLGDSDPIDECWIAGLPGESLRLRCVVEAGGANVLFSVLDRNDIVLGQLTVKPGKSKKKVVKISTQSLFRIVAQRATLGGPDSSWRIETSSKLPKLARSRTVKRSGATLESPIPFLAHAGTDVRIGAKALGKSDFVLAGVGSPAMPQVVQLLVLLALPQPEFEFDDLPISAGYTVETFASPNTKAIKIKLTLTPPIGASFKTVP
ncbi:MAG: PD40 domain-containing protein [Planctomycetes bacterium]|nr:PD40 domain-containing protein [Planctomycetota bacterium]